MNRIDRLSAILIHLQSKKIVRAQEIADRFEISLRTVYRDIRALEEAGVPIGAEAGVGYFLTGNYHLPPVMFTREEAGAFILAEKVLGKYSDRSVSERFSSAMYKIRSVLQNTDKDYLESIESRIDVLRYTSRRDEFPNNFTPQILDAIAENKLLEIEYYAAYRETVSVRDVEPVNLIHYSMNWHLIAWCRERNDYRDFRLDRIRTLKKTDETFESRGVQNAEEFLLRMMESAQLVEAKVRLGKKMQGFVAQTRFYYGFMHEERVGDVVEMTFVVNSLEYLASWLITLGGTVDVVSPPELVDLLRGRVDELAKKYLK